MGGYTSYVYTPGKPVWSGREYPKFADEGYVRNVVTHRCISMIANGAANIPWKLYKITENGKTQISKSHKIINLLRNPNPSMSGNDFLEDIYSKYLISGNAYIQAIRNPEGEIAELFSLRPDRVSVIAGRGSLPQGYRYKVGNDERDFPVNRITGKSNILHWKSFHPLDDWYGLSSIEAAAYSIDQHNQAGEWNQSLLQNGARPTGALIVKGSEKGGGDYLSDEQYNRIKSQIDEQHMGAANAGRPLLLEGGLDWKEMSLSPKDMDFINTKNSAARDIALAFGVPPQLLGIPGDNTYSNLAEARLSLWEQTILPLAEGLVNVLNNWLTPDFDRRFEIGLDKDNISALAPRREALWNRVKDAEFLTDEEKREMLI
ncbi:phage portal protein [Rickettsiales bacterium]|nr:phage portal protein [Rickettsiales bacterium]